MSKRFPIRDKLIRFVVGRQAVMLNFDARPDKDYPLGHWTSRYDVGGLVHGNVFHSNVRVEG